jgi:hypothetical protein
MTTANTFEVAAAELSFEEPSHFSRGFACMLEMPPEFDFGEKCDPLSWVNASIKFWAQLALQHVSPVIAERFAELPDTVDGVLDWANQIQQFAGPTTEVALNDEHRFVTLRWEEHGAHVKLDVWYSKSAHRLHSRLAWDTGTREPSAVLAAFGLDALLDLATMRDMLMDDES